jgi:hypothetical protein
MSQTWKITCDAPSCWKQMACYTDENIGYLELMTEDRRTLDFCSLACLAEYAEVMMEVEAREAARGSL